MLPLGAGAGFPMGNCLTVMLTEGTGGWGFRSGEVKKKQEENGWDGFHPNFS